MAEGVTVFGPEVFPWSFKWDTEKKVGLYNIVNTFGNDSRSSIADLLSKRFPLKKSKFILMCNKWEEVGNINKTNCRL